MITKTDKLQTRDFISIGIFSLIYSVVAFVVGGITQMTPITFPFMPMIVALFTGTVFMLFITKIPRKGAVTILGIIAGLMVFISGMFWLMGIFFATLGVVADFICASGNIRSFKKSLFAYCVFALSPMGAYIPMALIPVQFDEFMSKKGDVSPFAGIVDTIGTVWWILPCMLLGTILCAIIGGFIGRKLLKKHFEKAGIV